VNGNIAPQESVQTDIRLWDELMNVQESDEEGDEDQDQDDDDGQEEPNGDIGDLKDILSENGPVNKDLLDYFLVLRDE
jgi:hypothetical protein